MSKGSSVQSLNAGRGCCWQAACQALPQRLDLTESQALSVINCCQPERQLGCHSGQPAGRVGRSRGEVTVVGASKPCWAPSPVPPGEVGAVEQWCSSCLLCS